MRLNSLIGNVRSVTFHYSCKSLLTMILFFHENVEASVICFIQQYVSRVIMQIFSHKVTGFRRLFPTFFLGVNKSSVYGHILMFVFVKSNGVEED